MKSDNKSKSSSDPVFDEDEICEDGDLDTSDTDLIIYAAKTGDTDTCKQLLKAGIDVNVLSDDGSGPLHVAVEQGHVEIVELLLEQAPGCCDVNMCNALGQTALMIAVIFDDLEMVKILYKSGANLNNTDKTGKASLLRALQEKSKKSALYLIKHGCDVNVVDHLGQSALFLAVSSLQENCEKIVKALSKAGYDAEKDKPWLREAGLDVDHIQSGGLFIKLTKKFLKHISSNNNRKESVQSEKNPFRLLSILS